MEDKDNPTEQPSTPTTGQPTTTESTAPTAPVSARTNVVLTAEQLTRKLASNTRSARKQYQAELDEQARAAGWESHAHMLQNSRPPTPQPRPAAATSNRELQELRVKIAREEAKRRRIEQQLEQTELLGKLRLSAYHSGIRGDDNVDYAVERLRRYAGTLDPAKSGTVDDTEFFKTLLKNQPYLGGVQERPVTTANPQAPPRAPSPTEVRSGVTDDTKFNAMSASRAEVQARLAQLKIPSN